MWPATTWLLLGSSSGPARGSTRPASRPVSARGRTLNQTVMIVRLRLAVWPNALVLNYGWPELLTIGALPYLVTVVALGLISMSRSFGKPRLGFLGAWLFVTLAPTRASCRSPPRSAPSAAFTCPSSRLSSSAWCSSIGHCASACCRPGRDSGACNRVDRVGHRHAPAEPRVRVQSCPGTTIVERYPTSWTRGAGGSADHQRSP